MKALRISLVSGLVLALAACPPAEDRPAAGVAVNDTLAVRADTPRVDQIDDRAETVSMGEMHDSGVTGEAHVTPRNGETHVHLMIQGARPNATAQAHIHRGTCDTQGPVAHSLSAVDTNQQGRGESETTVGTAATGIFDGNHFVQVHTAGQEPGPPTACGDIPQRDMGQPRN